jgi:hypothetical protein
MIFQPGSSLGTGYCFPDICADIRADREGSFLIRFNLDEEIYAIIPIGISVQQKIGLADPISISGTRSHAAVPESFLPVRDEEEEGSLVEILSPLSCDSISDQARA